MTGLSVNSAFDGGNIIVHDASEAGNIRLSIRKDHAADFFQWFYFRLIGAENQDCRMVIENASSASYTAGWENYRACVSYDRETWFRIPTSFEDGALVINHTPELASVYYAYFAPFSIERHHDLIAEAALHPDAAISIIGTSIDGQSLDKIEIGEGDKTIWVIARQHPGETMAEWWMEGFIARLLDDDDPLSRRLRQKARFHIIPNMNPDGSKLGNLRTNRSGANLNREWGKASLHSSPEVYHTMNAMEKNKPSLVLDVHGDEALPYNFIAGAEGVPAWSDKMAKNQEMFLNAYKTASPDFQTKYGYAVSKPGKANLTMCTNFTAQQFKCLSMTLEMPFKDNDDLPDELFGWSPERAARLGASVLDAMMAVIEDL